jgi:hypothetical protein
LLPVVFSAVIWAVLLAATVVVVLSVVDSADVCWVADAVVVPVVTSAAVLSAVEVVELLEVRRGRASGRVEEPVLEAVDDATVFFDVVVDLPVVWSAAADDEVGALGPRAVWPVVFFADPELGVAELPELEAELWSVSSALATATTGPASDNPSARAAIPALAPR